MALQESLLESVESLKAGHQRILSVLTQRWESLDRYSALAGSLQSQKQGLEQRLEAAESTCQQIAQENMKKKNQLDSLLTVCELADHP